MSKAPDSVHRSALLLSSKGAHVISGAHAESNNNELVLPSAESLCSSAQLGRHPQHRSKWRRWWHSTMHHLAKHTGLGIICSVAYFDPGNWSVDLEAGSQFGYKLLFVVLLSGIFAVVFQSMSSHLGVVTGLDLASHCRLLLYNRPKHPKLYRWLLLYPLYALSEIAIISTDLAELLGSATALTLLFPALPLWGGVLLTSLDVFIILAISSPKLGQRQRFFELIIAILVFGVVICLIIVIAQLNTNWAKVFEGFLPSKTLTRPNALYTSIGIIGATVMPHGLFLGSFLATQDRVSSPRTTDTRQVECLTPSEDEAEVSLPDDDQKSGNLQGLVSSRVQSLRSLMLSLNKYEPAEDSGLPDCSKGHADWTNNTNDFIRAHLKHSIVDIVLSLLGIAVIINALILVIAGSVFYYGNGSNGNGSASTVPADLFQAYDLIKNSLGIAAAVLFALALLCAGESAGITATLAGQVVSEGFLRWRVSPIIRRALTRLLGLIPSMVVAISMGQQGMNTLLVASQVVLSIVLPFVVFPLIYITSSAKMMRVQKQPEIISNGEPVQQSHPPSSPAAVESQIETVDYSTGKIVTILAYIIWSAILLANVYVLITLGIGQD